MPRDDPNGSEMSTTEANKELVRRFNREVFSEGDRDAVEELVAADHVLHDPMTPEEVRGPEELKGQVEILRTAFPDLSMTEEDTITEGDTVAYRWTARGTHEGPFGDIEQPAPQ